MLSVTSLQPQERGAVASHFMEGKREAGRRRGLQCGQEELGTPLDLLLPSRRPPVSPCALQGPWIGVSSPAGALSGLPAAPTPVWRILLPSPPTCLVVPAGG